MVVRFKKNQTKQTEKDISPKKQTRNKKTKLYINKHFKMSLHQLTTYIIVYYNLFIKCLYRDFNSYSSKRTKSIQSLWAETWLWWAAKKKTLWEKHKQCTFYMLFAYNLQKMQWMEQIIALELFTTNMQKEINGRDINVPEREW